MNQNLYRNSSNSTERTEVVQGRCGTESEDALPFIQYYKCLQIRDEIRKSRVIQWYLMKSEYEKDHCIGMAHFPAQFNRSGKPSPWEGAMLSDPSLPSLCRRKGQSFSFERSLLNERFVHRIVSRPVNSSPLCYNPLPLPLCPITLAFFLDHSIYSTLNAPSSFPLAWMWSGVGCTN